MGRLHLVAVLMAITNEILTNDGRFGTSKRSIVDAMAKVGQCRFGTYIKDVFVFETDGSESNKVHNHICSAFSRLKRSLERFECVRHSTDPVEILGLNSYPVNW